MTEADVVPAADVAVPLLPSVVIFAGNEVAGMALAERFNGEIGTAVLTDPRTFAGFRSAVRVADFDSMSPTDQLIILHSVALQSGFGDRPGKVIVVATDKTSSMVGRSLISVVTPDDLVVEIMRPLKLHTPSWWKEWPGGKHKTDEVE